MFFYEKKETKCASNSSDDAYLGIAKAVNDIIYYPNKKNKMRKQLDG